MIVSGDYSIIQDKNKITITTPQSTEMLVDTATPIAKVKMLTSEQLYSILTMVKAYCELESEEQ